MAPQQPVIDIHGITKAYGGRTVLDGIDLRADRGEIVALLGPNGAGKTTMVKVLSTLVHPDQGSATIAGFDLRTGAAGVRESISLTGQHATVDGFLTGRENLVMMARLAHLRPVQARSRAAELLERFDLDEAADRRVATYSGGMRRRLDLALGLVVDRPVIFLDEPTTGLDPRSRLALWHAVRSLADDGATILLTTQYLDEADQLADRIAVIDGGRIVAEGTADDLKRGLSGDRVEIGFGDPTTFDRAVQVVSHAGLPPDADADRLTVGVAADPGATARVAKQLLDLMDEHGLAITTIAVAGPTLDDVFLSLTDRTREEVAA